MNKVCIKCGFELDENNRCKNCAKIYSAQWYIKNKERRNKQIKEWQINNKDKIRSNARKWRRENIELARERDRKKDHKQNTINRRRKWRKDNPEKQKGYLKKYRTINRKKVLARARYYAKKKRLSVSFRLEDAFRSGLYDALRDNKSGRHWESLVGYTLRDLKKHLESKFKDGMSWDNYGRFGWHIDHIVPKSRFNFKTSEDAEFKVCWGLSNLQPLWWSDNVSKSNKTMEEWQQQKVS
jgi:hypothetical protein